MRAAVGENATKDGPLPAEMRRARARPRVLSTIALRERRPGPTTARSPFDDSAMPATGRRSRMVRATRSRFVSTTDTERPPALVTNTIPPPGCTAMSNGLRPTRSDLTVRSVTRSTTASLRDPLKHVGAGAVRRQRDRGGTARRGDLAGHDARSSGSRSTGVPCGCPRSRRRASRRPRAPRRERRRARRPAPRSCGSAGRSR